MYDHTHLNLEEMTTKTWNWTKSARAPEKPHLIGIGVGKRLLNLTTSIHITLNDHLTTSLVTYVSLMSGVVSGASKASSETRLAFFSSQVSVRIMLRGHVCELKARETRVLRSVLSPLQAVFAISCWSPHTANDCFRSMSSNPSRSRLI